ncbi:MAG TPA: alpha/beta hydrolase [Brevundimonas sp.]
MTPPRKTKVSAPAEPRRFTVPVDNRWGAGEMAVLDFGDPDRPVDMVFVHATGFNAMTYRSLLAPLAGRFRIWAPDLRGHGRSALPTPPGWKRNWHDHRDDLTALLDTINGPPVVMAGHSMGATSSLLAAAERPGKVRELALLDPVIWSRLAVLALNLPVTRLSARKIPLAQNAARRRARFDSLEAAFTAYRGRGAFKGWPDAQLTDYLTDGFAAEGDGVALTCVPQWEAANYAAQAHNPWMALARIHVPVRILKAETHTTCFVPDHAFGMRHVESRTLAGSNHFFPMLMADEAREHLAAGLT